MKFCDKLIQLRKKNGLSQEELGDKLNVTRQTVSKWEMGQCKPETDKLIEMSKLFNVELNDLVDDNKKIEKVSDNSNIKHFANDDLKPRTWLLVVLIIIAIIISIVLGSKFLNIMSNWYSNIPENNIDNNNSNNDSFMDNFFDNIKEQINDGEKENFNFTYEAHSGTNVGIRVKNVLDDVITNNKTNSDHIISVVYYSTNTNNVDEIRNLKKNFDDWTDYEIILDYDEYGYINQITIEN